MGRTDLACRVVTASRAATYAALLDPDALRAWLPPSGMTASLRDFDPRVGGGYRMTLTYGEPTGGAGKTTEDSDEVTVRFVQLEPDQRVVQDVEFTSDDPAFAGTMRMTWSLAWATDGTEVAVRCDDVPPGIGAEEHLAGLSESLAHLAEYLA